MLQHLILFLDGLDSMAGLGLVYSDISKYLLRVTTSHFFFFGGTGLDGVDDRAGIDLFSYPTYFVVQRLQSIVSQYVNSPEYLHTCSFLQF